MDRSGRYADNLFIERLWRTLKYEEVYLKAYQDAFEARKSLSAYIPFYNTKRPHQSLRYKTPAEQSAANNMVMRTWLTLKIGIIRWLLR
jgi:putative transposase